MSFILDLFRRGFGTAADPDAPARNQGLLHGGILTGHQIRKDINSGRIEISDFDPKNLNPNSYNLSIGNIVRMYTNPIVFDLKDPRTYSELNDIELTDEGLVLRPGNLYLVGTKETVGSDYYEPIITGRSSIGRLGISVHQEAGFADIGYHGPLTLQIKVTYPTRIYPFLPIAQIYFLTPYGKISALYHGKYRDQSGPMASMWNAA